MEFPLYNRSIRIVLPSMKSKKENTRKSVSYSSVFLKKNKKKKLLLVKVLMVTLRDWDFFVKDKFKIESFK